VDWLFFGVLAAGASLLVGLRVRARGQQLAVADASGLAPVADLSHLPTALQRTALWSLADGGFERRVVHGIVTRVGVEVAVTAFDLETLRERRGEWAYLPVEPPFRLGGVVSVVVCELDRLLPHVLLKRQGRGDALADDETLELVRVAKLFREGLGVPRSYPADLPPTLAPDAIALELPAEWRAYASTSEAARTLLEPRLVAALARAGRRDLVIETIDSLVVVYPAARGVAGGDSLADLAADALEIVDALRDGPHPYRA
jgi:hypothetical protein